MSSILVSPRGGNKNHQTKFSLKKKKNKGDTDCAFRRASPFIPPIVELTCTYLEQKGKLDPLLLEGIFRVSGSAEDIRQIKILFETEKQVDLSKELNPNTVAGVLKLFFTELSNPIMTDELYPAWIEAFTFDEGILRLWCIRQVIDVMPSGAQKVLNRLFKTFHAISGHVEETKMSAQNLATVMHPILFRSPDATSFSNYVKDGTVRAGIVNLLIDCHGELFLEPQEAMDKKIRHDGLVTPHSEKKLFAFTHILRQNTIALATGLMAEGNTNIAVCFDKFNIEKNKKEQWATVPIPVLDEIDFPSPSGKGKKGISQSLTFDNPLTKSAQDADPRRESVGAVPVLRGNIKERHQKHKKAKKHMRKMSKDVPGETPTLEKRGSSIFFDERTTKEIVEDAGIDSGVLFEKIVEGDTTTVHQLLTPLSSEVRFLVIYRLQRSAKDFIVALDECKYLSIM